MFRGTPYYDGDFIKVGDVGDIMVQLDLVPKVLGDGYEQGILKAVQYLYERSQEIVPVDTSALKASGYYVVIGHGFEAKGSVGYYEHYAVYVHENPVPYHQPPTQYKFLEQPLRENRKYMLEIVRRQMNKVATGKLKKDPKPPPPGNSATGRVLL